MAHRGGWWEAGGRNHPPSFLKEKNSNYNKNTDKSRKEGLNPGISQLDFEGAPPRVENSKCDGKITRIDQNLSRSPCFYHRARTFLPLNPSPHLLLLRQFRQLRHSAGSACGTAVYIPPPCSGSKDRRRPKPITDGTFSCPY